VIDPDIEGRDEEEGPSEEVRAVVEAPRSRRALLTGMAAAAGALVAQAATAPLPAGAANGSNVKVGQLNSGTASTIVRNTANSATAQGLVGRSPQGIGIRGQGGQEGVWGTGGNYGVHGTTPSSTGYGVYGYGGAYGVYGHGSVYGVFGAGDNNGVYGNGTDYGTLGVAGSSGWGNYGVYGSSSSMAVYGSGGTYGVRGNGTSYGLYGTGPIAVYANGTNDGVFGYSPTGNGVYGSTSSGYAGWFAGATHVNGTLSKTAGSFMIDHPQEPQRRYLIHSFVEGPERLNVYRGTIKLNARGRATVHLPRYFESANREPSYQLTAVGAAAPSLHIAKGVEGNRFVIAGGAPGQTVSWMVTAARDDAWAQRNPLRVEPLKARGDRGKYLNPEVFGKPRSAGINHVALRRATRVPKLSTLPKPQLKGA
jgi:hypothetical protein